MRRTIGVAAVLPGCCGLSVGDITPTSATYSGSTQAQVSDPFCGAQVRNTSDSMGATQPPIAPYSDSMDAFAVMDDGCFGGNFSANGTGNLSGQFESPRTLRSAGALNVFNTPFDTNFDPICSAVTALDADMRFSLPALSRYRMFGVIMADNYGVPPSQGYRSDVVIELRTLAGALVQQFVGAGSVGNPIVEFNVFGNLAAGNYRVVVAGDASANTLNTTFNDAAASFDVTFTLDTCNDTDFNNDGVFPDTADLFGFINVFSGAPCPVVSCDSVDFNNDGVFPDTADLFGFISVFSGAACPQ